MYFLKKKLFINYIFFFNRQSQSQFVRYAISSVNSISHNTLNIGWQFKTTDTIREYMIPPRNLLHKNQSIFFFQ